MYCTRCGRKGHLVTSCFSKTTIISSPLNQNNRCFRCGRNGHWLTDCFAKTDIGGNKIKDNVNEINNKGIDSKFLLNYDNKSNVLVSNPKLPNLNDMISNCCYRCGRNGHWLTDCFAKTDIDGNIIKDNIIINNKEISELNSIHVNIRKEINQNIALARSACIVHKSKLSSFDRKVLLSKCQITESKFLIFRCRR
jgi:hypothetical protein